MPRGIFPHHMSILKTDETVGSLKLYEIQHFYHASYIECMDAKLT